MTEQDEQRRIERCRAGDMAAWRDLVSAYNDPFLAIAYRIVLLNDEAQDTVQDAWIRNVQNLSRFDGRSSFRTWATAIVIRVALTRARSSRLHIPLDDAPFLSISGEDCGATLETRLDLREALAALSPEDRTAVILHYGEGYTFAEIGVMMNVPQRTAANRAYRGMKTLRERMAKLAFGRPDHAL